MFFDGLESGWYTFKKTVKFSFRNPLLLLPMLLAVAGVVYGSYYGVVELDLLAMPIYYMVAYYVVVATIVISLSSLILLELLEQKETHGKMNVFKAVFDAVVFDLWRTLPLIVVWAVLKFLVSMLEVMVMLAKAKSKDRNRSSYRRRRTSRRTSNFLTIIQTGIRLASMTVLTAVAWEPINPFKAIGKGVRVYREQLGEVAVGVGLSNVLKLVMLIPSIGAYYLMDSAYAGDIPSEGYLAILIYFGVIWAITLMVEQIYVAELYIWYKVFEGETRNAELEGYDKPSSMRDVKERPSLFDNVASFADENKTKGPERY